MMRDCEDGEMRDLLPLFARGKLPPADRARVDAHVAHCEACAAELEVLRAVSLAFSVPALDAARIANALPVRRRASGGVPFRRQSLWRIAASLTLMITGVATVMVVRQRAASNPAAATAPRDTGGPASPGGAVPAASVASSGAQPAAGAAEGGLGFGVSLSDLTDAQLETLLGSLDRIEANVPPDPEKMAKPIVPPTADSSTRN